MEYKQFTNAVRPESVYKEPLRQVRLINTIREMFDTSTELFAGRTAFLVKDKIGGPYREITYAEARRDVYALGTAFMALDLRGKKIAVVGENRYEWAITYLATVCGVGTIVPLDKELPTEEMQNLIERAKVSAVVYSGKMRKKHESLFADNAQYMCINMDDDTTDVSLKQLIEKGNELIMSGNDAFVKTCPRPDDVNIVLFTSGTTGRAKGVMLSHRNITSNLMNMLAMHKILNENDRFFSFLPIHHTYECTCGMLCPLYCGASIAYCEGLKYIVKNMQEAQPTYFLAVPQVVEALNRQIWAGIRKKGKEKLIKRMIKITDFLLKLKIDLRKKIYAEIHNTFGGKMRLFISGAAALDPEIIKSLRSLGFNTVQGYGMTECAPIAAVNRDIYWEDASCGQPCIEVDVKIDNPDENGIGEILIKGDNVMVGYYEDEEETAKTIVDGWLHTGDMGYMDDRCFIYITGRLKNVIVTANGENVYPEEVETYLQRSAYIAETMVYADADRLGNETVVSAHILPDFNAVEEALGKEYTEDALRDLIDKEVKAVNAKMAPSKRVMKFDVRHEDFVKTTTKKIKRYAN
ncbi:MAG: AMP-binding protein [Clostridia bacterium]|nr:AMP-binding protein [Clostridia bacterium]